MYQYHDLKVLGLVRNVICFKVLTVFVDITESVIKCQTNFDVFCTYLYLELPPVSWGTLIMS